MGHSYAPYNFLPRSVDIAPLFTQSLLPRAICRALGRCRPCCSFSRSCGLRTLRPARSGSFSAYIIRVPEAPESSAVFRVVIPGIAEYPPSTISRGVKPVHIWTAVFMAKPASGKCSSQLAWPPTIAFISGRSQDIDVWFILF